MTITAFPLAWPPGWKRTAARAEGNFRTGSSPASSKPVTITQATQRLRLELGRMGVHDRNGLIVSSNLQLRQDGLPYADQRKPADPGAAAYWNDPWTKAPRCMAIDRYTKVEMNIAALAATIEAMRAIERHGGAIVLERAFTGFTALPAPIVAGMKRDWWLVLLLDTRHPTAEEIQSAYRRLASKYHPDRDGGDAAKMAEINQARDDALKEIQ
jgi:hypothetical protein